MMGVSRRGGQVRLIPLTTLVAACFVVFAMPRRRSRIVEPEAAT